MSPIHLLLLFLFTTSDYDHSMETTYPEMTYEEDVNAANSMMQDNNASVGQANEEYESDRMDDQEIEYVSVPIAKRVKRNNGECQYNLEILNPKF